MWFVCTLCDAVVNICILVFSTPEAQFCPPYSQWLTPNSVSKATEINGVALEMAESTYWSTVNLLFSFTLTGSALEAYQLTAQGVSPLRA